MDAKKLGKSPVAPLRVDVALGGTITTPGLTLRQHYAGLAMQGIVSDSAAVYEATGEKLSLPTHARLIAEAAVSMADALLAELAKEANDGR